MQRIEGCTSELGEESGVHGRSREVKVLCVVGTDAITEGVEVEVLVLANDLIERESYAGVGRGERGRLVPAVAVGEQAHGRSSHRIDVTHGAECTRLPVTHDLGQ